MTKRSGKGNRPHRVNLCRWAKPPSGKDGYRGTAGGRLALFAFSWADLQALTGLEPRKLQRMARVGKFDPRDLESVANLWHGLTCAAVAP